MLIDKPLLNGSENASAETRISNEAIQTLRNLLKYKDKAMRKMQRQQNDSDELEDEEEEDEDSENQDALCNGFDKGTTAFSGSEG